ncbi:hypothetical protein Bca4012_066589 [Brassica carinata]
MASLLTSPLTKPKPLCLSSPPRTITTSPSLNLTRISFTHSQKLAPFKLPSFLSAFSEKGPKRDVTASATASEPGDYRRIMLSDVMVKKKKDNVPWWEREWSPMDFGAVAVVLSMHVLSLLAPFQFNWRAVSVAFGLYIVTGLLGVTLSFHRNLSHKSFKLPKWLEYLFAYCGAQALQGNPIDWVGERNNVGDLEKQPFYQFLRSTYIWHPVALAVALYALGGLPFVVWGMGVRIVWVYHITWLVNSACHVWGEQAWNTGDLSKNNWFVAALAFGEGWHNNHHAFEFSARHGLEWWQLDMTWYVVRFLQAIGLATDVKLPSEAQKQRMALTSD